MPGTGRALIKVEDDFSRNFPIANIPHREAHAEPWIWMGEGTDGMWRMNTKGSLAKLVPQGDAEPQEPVAA